MASFKGMPFPFIPNSLLSTSKIDLRNLWVDGRGGWVGVVLQWELCGYLANIRPGVMRGVEGTTWSSEAGVVPLTPESSIVWLNPDCLYVPS